MIISITGTPGSGKSTLGRLLAKKRGYRFISMGDIRGQMAVERGMTINDLNRIGETEDTDTMVDGKVRDLGKEDDLVLDSRMAAFFIPRSFKVFVDADEKVRAERIMSEERPDESYQSISEARAGMRQREASDTKRYKRHYGFRWNDASAYDLVLDSTHSKPEELVEKIEKAIQLKISPKSS